MALSSKKTAKLWIWKVLDSATGELLEWECGDRGATTLKRLYERIKDWDALLYCSDDLEAYKQVIPPEKHKTGKDLTYSIEQNNGRQRHWLGRLRRKSIIVSRSVERVDLSIFLFAAFHVNKTLQASSSLFT